jgi:mannose-6-phosphate isomerase-like protein (cupin superfamily)
MTHDRAGDTSAEARKTGTVADSMAVPPRPTAGGALVRTVLDAAAGCPQLTRRLINLPPGTWLDAGGGPGGQVLFVIGGRCRAEAGDSATVPGSLPASGIIGPDTGLWLPPGGTCRIWADGPEEARLDSVTLPGTPGPAAAAGPPVVSRLADCPKQRTGDRSFRVLLGPGNGCPAATQFAGEIPPGRAPAHRHPYDEVVLVLDGEGIVHLADGTAPLRAGSCVYLPPGEPHCLENTGPATLRVLGVFHPAGSPAAKLPNSG